MNTMTSACQIEMDIAEAKTRLRGSSRANPGLRVRSGLRAGSTTKSSDKAQKQYNDYLRS